MNKKISVLVAILVSSNNILQAKKDGSSKKPTASTLTIDYDQIDQDNYFVELESNKKYLVTFENLPSDGEFTRLTKDFSGKYINIPNSKEEITDDLTSSHRINTKKKGIPFSGVADFGIYIASADGNSDDDNSSDDNSTEDDSGHHGSGHTSIKFHAGEHHESGDDNGDSLALLESKSLRINLLSSSVCDVIDSTPVCGELDFGDAGTVQKTYTNSCELDRAGAELISEGNCP